MPETLLAAAICGMKASGEVDKRCLKFTIHLRRGGYEDHLEMAHLLHRSSENFYFQKGKTYKGRVSHTGLMYFQDRNGSKFSGSGIGKFSNDDHHSHGTIFLPRDTSDADVEDIIKSLRIKSKFHPNVKSSPNAVEIERFEWEHEEVTLLDWIKYCSKYEIGLEKSHTMMIAFPFDLFPKGSAQRKRMEIKQRDILAVLRSSNPFKIVAGLYTPK